MVRGLLFLLLFSTNCITYCQKSWTQLGHDIKGDVAGDESGRSVSLSADGQTVAIGAAVRNRDGSKAGHVRIYKFIDRSWVQQGQTINGEAADDLSGNSVSLSDNGLTVAIGAPFNSGSAFSSGHVRVYRLINDVWIKLGQDIDGVAAHDKSGFSVSLSADGLNLAIGAIGNNRSSGQVRVYRYGFGTWTQQGQDINGEAIGDQSGYAISLGNNGLTLAIGAPFNSEKGEQSGQVKIYKLEAGKWMQEGEDINGTIAGERLGKSVSLSTDGRVVAIGIVNGGSNVKSGLVRVYQLDDGSWTQLGADILGEANGDRSGNAISLSDDGSIIAIGAPGNDGGGSNAGHVRVYQFLSGTWTQQGRDLDGNAAGNGLGNAVSINDDGWTVAVGAPANGGISSGAIEKGYVKVFRFCSHTRGSISPQACNSYTSPSQKYTWTNSGTYLDTILNAEGCDSVITIRLTLNNSSSTIYPTACNSYIAPSQKYTWTNSGTYLDTISNAAGCDSIITIHLRLSNGRDTIHPTACGAYTSPSGKYVWSNSGVYSDTLIDNIGCDSIISIDLSIIRNSADTIRPFACNEYTSPSGKYTWNSSGIYLDTILNAEKCDSIIRIQLSIDTFNIGINKNGATIMAGSFTTAYQWLDCNNNYAIIPGAITQVYTPALSGNYAVELRSDNCTDTSTCVEVSTKEINDRRRLKCDSIYPNPSRGIINIDFETDSRVIVQVYDLSGRVIYEEKTFNNKNHQIELDIASGIYLVKLNSAESEVACPLIKK